MAIGGELHQRRESSVRVSIIPASIGDFLMPGEQKSGGSVGKGKKRRGRGR
jgi:hypothetical protein